LVRARTLEFHGAVVEEIQEKRAEQSRAEQSRAEQGRGEETRRGVQGTGMGKWRNGKKARGKTAAMIRNTGGWFRACGCKNGNTAVCWIF